MVSVGVSELRNCWYVHVFEFCVIAPHWNGSAEFSLFPGLWLVKQFPHISSQTTDWIELKFGGWSHYGTLQVWLTFGYELLNSCHFLASDLLSSFCVFVDKLLIWLTSNLVGELIMGLICLSRPYQNWLTFGNILLNPWFASNLD